MEKTKMESFVNCPQCGELVLVVMKQYQEAINELIRTIEMSGGIGKTDHFEGGGKCKCGTRVEASLHVTAMAKR